MLPAHGFFPHRSVVLRTHYLLFFFSFATPTALSVADDDLYVLLATKPASLGLRTSGPMQGSSGRHQCLVSETRKPGKTSNILPPCVLMAPAVHYPMQWRRRTISLSVSVRKEGRHCSSLSLLLISLAYLSTEDNVSDQSMHAPMASAIRF